MTPLEPGKTIATATVTTDSLMKMKFLGPKSPEKRMETGPGILAAGKLTATLHLDFKRVITLKCTVIDRPLTIHQRSPLRCEVSSHQVIDSAVTDTRSLPQVLRMRMSVEPFDQATDHTRWQQHVTIDHQNCGCRCQIEDTSLGRSRPRDIRKVFVPGTDPFT